MSALDVLKKLDAEATRGPWTWIGPPYYAGSGCVRAPGHEAAVFYGRGWASARENRPDLWLSVALRNALPALIAYIEAAGKLRAWSRGDGQGPLDVLRDKYDAAEAALARALEGEK